MLDYYYYITIKYISREEDAGTIQQTVIVIIIVAIHTLQENAGPQILSQADRQIQQIFLQYMHAPAHTFQIYVMMMMPIMM